MLERKCTIQHDKLPKVFDVVVATMLGVEDGDFVQFKHWSDTIFTNIGEILIGTPSEAAVQAGGEMSAYFLERIGRLREKPGVHLLSDLVYVETEEGRLTDGELLMFCVVPVILAMLACLYAQCVTRRTKKQWKNVFTKIYLVVLFCIFVNWINKKSYNFRIALIINRYKINYKPKH